MVGPVLFCILILKLVIKVII